MGSVSASRLVSSDKKQMCSLLLISASDPDVCIQPNWSFGQVFTHIPWMGDSNLCHFLYLGFQLVLKPALHCVILCQVPTTTSHYWNSWQLRNLTSSDVSPYCICSTYWNFNPCKNLLITLIRSDFTFFPRNPNFDLDQSQTPRLTPVWGQISAKLHCLDLFFRRLDQIGADKQIAFYTRGLG